MNNNTVKRLETLLTKFEELQIELEEILSDIYTEPEPYEEEEEDN